MPAPIRLTVVATLMVALLFLADALSWATWRSKHAGLSGAGPSVGVGIGRSGSRAALRSAGASALARSAGGSPAGGPRVPAPSARRGGGSSRSGAGVPAVGVNSGGQTATTTGASPGEGTTPTTQGGSDVPAPPAWGTYQVNQSGSFTSSIGKPYTYPPVGTLVVNQADADGRQLWQRYVQSGSQPSDTTLQYGSSGPHILSMSEAGSPCTFAPPGVPAPPWPIAPGETATSDGQCGSGSNSFHLHLVEDVKDTESYRLPDGATVPVWRIDTTITITGSNFKASGTQVDDYSAAYRLPIEEDVNVSGTYDSVVHFALNSRSILQSTTPTQS